MKKESIIPSVSALVVNHNGGQEILNCLEALTHQQVLLDQIILVDNASTDGSPAQVSKRYPQVKILRLEDNYGLSKARNIGLKEISSDYVLVVDDDVYLDSDSLDYLWQAQIKYSAAVVCPRILLHPEKVIVQCDGAAPHFVGTMKLRHAFKPVNELDNDVTEVQACIGACMLVDREIIVAAGGYDENLFFYFEDLEFTLRIRSLGYKIICEPKALVYHDRGLGTPLLSFRGRGPYPKKRAYFNIRHRWIVILTHYKTRTLLVLFPVLLVYEIATVSVVIMRGWIKSWLRALMSIFVDHKNVANRRNFVQQNRRRRDKDLLSGGQLPLAQGFLSGKLEIIAVGALSWCLDIYWKLVRNWIG